MDAYVLHKNISCRGKKERAIAANSTKKEEFLCVFLKCSRPDLCFKCFQVGMSRCKPNYITIRITFSLNTKCINTGVLFAGE